MRIAARILLTTWLAVREPAVDRRSWRRAAGGYA